MESNLALLHQIRLQRKPDEQKPQNESEQKGVQHRHADSEDQKPATLPLMLASPSSKMTTSTTTTMTNTGVMPQAEMSVVRSKTSGITEELVHAAFMCKYPMYFDASTTNAKGKH